MRAHALDIIRDEHRALAGMLTSLRSLVRDVRDQGRRPDFALFRAIVYYLYAFPERLHHPKETDTLFRLLRARDPGDARATLDRLDADHERGEDAVRRLAMALLEYEQLGDARRGAFVEQVERYVDGYLRHMEIEEREVLPLAERLLGPADWETVEAAFSCDRDPLTGHPPAAEYRALFSRIVNLAPAPIGLGPAAR
ncbi:MAG: hemerythrin domain-containing protein [Burkholderiaceae bacterium]|jgi:hemerythrin-like domain-containing protein